MSESAPISTRHDCLTIRAPMVVALALSVVLSGGAAPGAKNPDVIWIEGEEAVSHHPAFAPFVDLKGKLLMCSGGMSLRLMAHENHLDATTLPCYAEYEFNIAKEGGYKIWIACTPMTEGWASPLGYRLDGGKRVSMEGIKRAGAYYGKMYAWHAIGVHSLRKGRHTLRLEVLRRRKMDDIFSAFIDAILVTPELGYVPAGYTEYSPFAPSPTTTELELYKFHCARATAEEIGAESGREVREKLSRRPNKPPARPVDGVRRFGLHGAEQPFITWNGDLKRQADFYDLISRAGVQTFRTSEGCWHRLGKTFSDFRDFDYQIANAVRRGQTFNLTVGYPDNDFTVVASGLSTFKPEYEELYRKYVRSVLDRAKRDGATVEFFEIGNEIDAGFLWYKGGTPESYVKECRIWKEESAKVLPGAKICAFGGVTWSRDPKAKPPEWGRAFVDQCFQLGINQYADAYSMHYAWPTKEKEFNEYLDRKMKEAGGNRLKLNTEESAYRHPADILKLFARDFFLWGYQRVDYFHVQDRFNGVQFINNGLFDRDWNPKLRLLSYALSVDAMDGRVLAGMAAPAKNIEAYVLRFPAGTGGATPKYSIVLWENDAQRAPELISPPTCNPDFKGRRVCGFQAVASAWNWRLDPIPFDAKRAAFKVTPNPIVVFANALPNWRLMSAAEWKAGMDQREHANAAPVPNQ